LFVELAGPANDTLAHAALATAMPSPAKDVGDAMLAFVFNGFLRRGFF
jgi:hypothetical protein